jgi:hypothetical protein
MHAIARYWTARGGARSERKAHKHLIQLADRSLLRLDGHRARLHDIQFDYLVATGSNPLTLGRTLLDAYRAEGHWTEIEPDGYIHEHLIRHLVEQGDREEVERTLDVTSSEGSNAWFSLVERIDNLSGFLDDLDRSTQAWSERRLHHALMRASINSLSSSVSNEVRVALMRTKLWSPKRALADARQVADVDRRISASLDLVPHLDMLDSAATVREAVDLANTRGDQARGTSPSTATPRTGSGSKSSRWRPTYLDADPGVRRAPIGPPLGARTTPRPDPRRRRTHHPHGSPKTPATPQRLALEPAHRHRLDRTSHRLTAIPRHTRPRPEDRRTPRRGTRMSGPNRNQQRVDDHGSARITKYRG